MAICPECENPLDLDEDELEAGETLECEECGAELEVATLNPLQLTVLAGEGYDEEEDSYEEEEE